MRWRIVAWCAVGAFAAFRLPELTRYALWYDELFSLSLAQRDWGDLLAGAVADRTNPPLFYALLKAWIGVGGESVAWMRLLPCALGILVAVPMVALARRVAGELAVTGQAPATPLPPAEPRAPQARDIPPAGDIANPIALPFTIALVALAAASPLAVFLSNELRAYSLLTLLSAAWLLAYFRVSESAAWLAPGTVAAHLGNAPDGNAPDGNAPHGDAPHADAAHGNAPHGNAPGWHDDARGEHRRRVAQLTIAAVLLVYTHYFGWLLIAATIGAALFWRRGALAGVFLAAGVAGFAFLPWAAAVAVNAARVARPLANVAWVAPPRPGDIPLFYDALVARVLTSDTAWVGALVLAALGAGLVLWLRRAPRGSPPRRVTAELALLAVAPVLVAYVASVATSQSAFVPRYLMEAAPAWWLLVALATSALGSATARGRAMELDSHRWGAAVAVSVFTLVAGALREARGGEKIPWDAVVRAIAADRAAHRADAATDAATDTAAADSARTASAAARATTDSAASTAPSGWAAAGTIYALEGFTALQTAYYAAALGTGLRVRPVTSLDSIVPPAWLVVRAAPGADASSAAALSAGRTPRGIRLGEVYVARIPSQEIIAYRVTRP